MRARYTANTLAHEDFLLRTWHPAKPQPRHPCRAALASVQPATRPQTLALRAAAPVKWLGLTILRTDGGGPQDIDGTVEFVARYKPSGRAERLHEVSRFVRENDQWFYAEGEIRSVAHGNA
jgi:SEC-C motif-containing protein